MFAIPVNVKAPIIIPTIAQASPTGKAVLAPSAKESLQSIKVFFPPLTKKFQTNNINKVAIIIVVPNLKKEEAINPNAIQKINLFTLDEKPRVMDAPRIKKVVKIKPIIPAYKGV